MIADEYVFDEHPKPQEIEDFLEGPSAEQFTSTCPLEPGQGKLVDETSRRPPRRTIRAYAMILIRPLPLGLSLFYIPRGPIVNYQDEPLIRFFFAKLKKLARRSNAVTIRFDPNLIDRTYPYVQRNRNTESIVRLPLSGS